MQGDVEKKILVPDENGLLAYFDDFNVRWERKIGEEDGLRYEFDSGKSVDSNRGGYVPGTFFQLTAAQTRRLALTQTFISPRTMNACTVSVNCFVNPGIRS